MNLQELAPGLCIYYLKYRQPLRSLFDEVAMTWTYIKHIWDILKDKIGQFWEYLTGRGYSISRLVPARAVQRQPKAYVLRKEAENSPLDPNRFQLD